MVLFYSQEDRQTLQLFEQMNVVAQQNKNVRYGALNCSLYAAECSFSTPHVELKMKLVSFPFTLEPKKLAEFITYNTQSVFSNAKDKQEFHQKMSSSAEPYFILYANNSAQYYEDLFQAFSHRMKVMIIQDSEEKLQCFRGSTLTQLFGPFKQNKLEEFILRNKIPPFQEFQAKSLNEAVNYSIRVFVLLIDPRNPDGMKVQEDF